MEHGGSNRNKCPAPIYLRIMSPLHSQLCPHQYKQAPSQNPSPCVAKLSSKHPATTRSSLREVPLQMLPHKWPPCVPRGTLERGKKECQGDNVALQALLTPFITVRWMKSTQQIRGQSSHQTYRWSERRKPLFHWPPLGQSVFYQCQEDHTAGSHVEAEDKGKGLRWLANIWMLK